MPDERGPTDEWAKVRQFTDRLRTDQALRREFEADPVGASERAGLPRPFQASLAQGGPSQRSVPEPRWCFEIGGVTICVTPWW